MEIGQLNNNVKRILDISGTVENNSKDVIGNIRINPKNFTDAFVNDPEGGADIYIDGPDSRCSALEGDLVKVKLFEKSKWKLNTNIIASRWDEWSTEILPIIQKIESDEAIVKQFKSIVASTSAQTTSQDGVETEAEIKNSNVKLSRSKRSISNGRNNCDTNSASTSVATSNANKLPSNLPPGISKLETRHIINLNLASYCLQKTGFVVEILKRNHLGVAGGTLRWHNPEFALFSPKDPRVPRMLIDIRQCPVDFSTKTDRYKNILFVAQMTAWSGGKNYASGNLVKIIGDSNLLASRMEALLLEHQIYDHEFPPDVDAELDYLNYLPDKWFESNSVGRRDLTDECVLTIDPKTARDLDDALHVKQIAEQIYEVGVHIADVSYFVKELSAVDYHARLRTTSVYLVDRVIPMLPRILCERMCSLNPGETKLTFSVIWKMDKYGRIIDQWFGRTVIKSCAKLAYEQAQDMIDNPEDVSWIKEGSNMPKLYNYDWKYVSKSVCLLNKIAQRMRAKRFEDGALKIDQVKIKFELDQETGFPTGFAFEKRFEANYLIEEFMLLANMAVAKRIYQFSEHIAFLRRHPASSVKLMTEVKEFCEAKGCPLDISSSGALQKSLNSITDPTMCKVVSWLLLRSMKAAEYICAGSIPEDDENGFRHFALNVSFYTHFTSPIRRYADVIVHRLLSMALGYEHHSNEEINSLTMMADECTKRKISSKTISDTSQKWYFNLFVQKAGFCELLACVTRIYDQSFDIILVDYDRSGRVYMDRLKSHLNSFRFESLSGVKRLILNWKQSGPMNPNGAGGNAGLKRSKKKKSKIGRDSGLDLNSRASLETKKSFNNKDIESQVNEAKKGSLQMIEVFDVIRVIVTIDEKDITQLKFDLKVPDFCI